jgi:galactosylceramidase
VHWFNDDFISRDATKIINWYLVGSTYGIQPYADQPPALIARSPWSGHYALKPIIWSYAHYGQFVRIGWRYVSSGCLALSGGGTIVTLKSDAGDYSVIAETADATAPQHARCILRPPGGHIAWQRRDVHCDVRSGCHLFSLHHDGAAKRLVRKRAGG